MSEHAILFLTVLGGSATLILFFIKLVMMKKEKMAMFLPKYAGMLVAVAVLAVISFYSFHPPDGVYKVTDVVGVGENNDKGGFTVWLEKGGGMNSLFGFPSILAANAVASRLHQISGQGM